MYEVIKKFLANDGKCLLIEDGKPIGVVLTMEEYEKLKENKKPELLMSDINTVVDFPEASAELADIDLAGDDGDVTLEDLGLDELPY